MKVLYCEEHHELGDEHGCWVARQPMQANIPLCRMVPMRLIPDDPRLSALIETFEEVLAALDGETP